MRQVKIMSGVSGSGKSTLVRKLLSEHTGPMQVVSADQYFMVKDENAKHGNSTSELIYKFNPADLSLAHGNCFRRFIEGLQSTECGNLVIVDNTNTTTEEIAPYVLGAQAFGYDLEVITVMCNSMSDVEQAAKRNAHGVPLQGVYAQYMRIHNRKLPTWWKSQVIPFARG